jgi:hypothetical protein
MEWFRDLIIIIFGIVGIIAVVLHTLLRVSTHRRIMSILDSVKATTKNVEEITETVESQIAGPLGTAINVIRGIREGVGLVSSIGKKKKKKKDD